MFASAALTIPSPFASPARSNSTRKISKLFPLFCSFSWNKEDFPNIELWGVVRQCLFARQWQGRINRHRQAWLSADSRFSPLRDTPSFLAKPTFNNSKRVFNLSAHRGLHFSLYRFQSIALPETWVSFQLLWLVRWVLLQLSQRIRTSKFELIGYNDNWRITMNMIALFIILC